MEIVKVNIDHSPGSLFACFAAVISFRTIESIVPILLGFCWQQFHL